MAEKENKSAAMNKNVDKKPAGSGIGGLPTVGQKAMANHTGSAGAPGGGAINVKDQYRNNQDQQRPPREGKIFTKCKSLTCCIAQSLPKALYIPVRPRIS